MHDAFWVAELQSVSYGEHDLRDLIFIHASMQIVGRVEFSAFTELHNDVKVPFVVVNLKNLDDVGVVELTRSCFT